MAMRIHPMWRNKSQPEDMSELHKLRTILLGRLKPDLSNYGKLMKKFGKRTGWPSERVLRETFKKKDLKKLVRQLHG